MVSSKAVLWKFRTQNVFHLSVQGTVLLVVITLALFFASSPAFAAGGACPSGNTTIDPNTGQGINVANVGVSGEITGGITSCFYASKSSGSDSNSGTSESTPWAHIPGMSGCSATCASTTPSAGEGFILRGGDTWTTSDMNGLNWTWSGNSSHPLYIGIDPAWHSGSSWVRPVFNGGAATTANMFNLANDSYVVVDNIEAVGMRNNAYGVNCSGGSDDRATQLYFHGWSHTGNSNNVGFFGQCTGGSVIDHNIVDGSDSIIAGPSGSCGSSQCGTFNGTFLGIDTFQYNVVRYVVAGYLGVGNIIHDNLVEFPVYSVDGDHANGIYNEAPSSGTNFIAYNNVVRNTSNCAGCVNFYILGDTGSNSDYQVFWFNNVMYNLDASNVIDLGESNASGNYGNWYFFNNTVECGNDSSQTACYNGQTAVTMDLRDTNNHWIGSSSSQCGGRGVGGTCTATTNLNQTVATANAAGYTSSQTYAFYPTSGSSPTAGSGTSEISGYCSTLSAINSAAGTACQNATGYACTYNSTNHTVGCPNLPLSARDAWNIGAYQFNSGDAPPNPPTGLSAVVN